MASISINTEILPLPRFPKPETGPAFSDVLHEHQLQLKHIKPKELQVNLGKLCNLACHHCHVDAGPKRTEIMQWSVMQRILDWAQQAGVERVDLTGGAPELNPHFREFCAQWLQQGVEITSRCNITVLFEPGQEDLAQWYAEHRIRLVCSLPCYTEDNVDAQRGKGTFDKSIAGLQKLNSLGYGVQPELPLDLVYNPGGAFLPPDQQQLEQDYRRMLGEQFDIRFTQLLALANLPVNRFAHALQRDGKLAEYQALLTENFNAQTVDNLMCRSLLSLDWQGRVYDCDFNQMLDIPLGGEHQQYLWDLDAASIAGTSVQTERHCFGCTAGAGSSCGGALAD